MEIIVCIKQVPDTTDVKVDPQRKTLVRDGVRSILNPFDVHAIEEALRLKELAGGRVTAITMGPPQARMALEEAIAMGADEAALVSHKDFAGSDTLATSIVLSSAIRKIGTFDIILCGKQASDGDTAQVGPAIAARLHLPQIIFARRIVNIEQGRLRAERVTEEGSDIVTAPLPCLVTIVREANLPRYASFSGKVRAKRTHIPTWGSDDIDCEKSRVGLDGSPTWVDRIFAPPIKNGCTPIAGNTENIGSVAQKILESLEKGSC
jgi:electron transfer flavoprotein beta subunit